MDISTAASSTTSATSASPGGSPPTSPARRVACGSPSTTRARWPGWRRAARQASTVVALARRARRDRADVVVELFGGGLPRAARWPAPAIACRLSSTSSTSAPRPTSSARTACPRRASTRPASRRHDLVLLSRLHGERRGGLAARAGPARAARALRRRRRVARRHGHRVDSQASAASASSAIATTALAELLDGSGRSADLAAR